LTGAATPVAGAADPYEYRTNHFFTNTLSSMRSSSGPCQGEPVYQMTDAAPSKVASSKAYASHSDGVQDCSNAFVYAFAKGLHLKPARIDVFVAASCDEATAIVQGAEIRLGAGNESDLSASFARDAPGACQPGVAVVYRATFRFDELRIEPNGSVSASVLLWWFNKDPRFQKNVHFLVDSTTHPTGWEISGKRLAPAGSGPSAEASPPATKDTSWLQAGLAFAAIAGVAGAIFAKMAFDRRRLSPRP
jgi:hypothetical protein